MESTTQIFLRVQVTDDEHDVVSGEALVEGYADRMQIESFSFDMKAKLQSPGPADEKPKHNCQFGHVVVNKVFDRASTRLASLVKRVKNNKEPCILSEVRITIDQQLLEAGSGYKSGSQKTQNAIMVLHLSHARVVDYKLSVTEEKASASAKETVSFTFQNVSIEYYFKSDTSSKRSDYRDDWVGFETNYEEQDPN